MRLKISDIKYFCLLIVLFFLVEGFSQEAGLNDSTDNSYWIIRNLTFSGNKVTHDRIIQRELLLKAGDTIPALVFTEKVSQSQKNLMNTSLFNFVVFDTIPVDGEEVLMDVNVDFLEQWYIWPVPIIELADRNLNEWLKKKDLERINYGMFLTWNNFRGRREKLIIYARFGYDEKYNFSYKIPYINKKQTIGLGFSSGFKLNHEISVNSIDNEEIYYKNEESRAKNEFFAYSELFYRKGIHNQHWAVLGYSDLNVADSVIILNPDYIFGSTTQNQSINFFYQFRSDFRDYTQYPLNGYYFDIEMDKRGIGLFSESEVNSLYFKTNFRKYNRIKGRLFWATGITAKYSPLKDQPYFYMNGLGYGRDFVRGYEYYVIDGQHFGLLKNNLKFELIPQTVQEFKFIPTDKFNKLYYAVYVNLYADFGYVFDEREIVSNPLANKLLPGYGIGIDLVTYYNSVFRIEFSVNKMGETGFFIHLMPSI